MPVHDFRQIKDTDVINLLDCGSSFSSISEHLVTWLHLTKAIAPTIFVRFRDRQKVYKSSEVVTMPMMIGGIYFSHSCYVLPKRQLFQVTLRYDWLKQQQANLDFRNMCISFPVALKVFFQQNHSTIPHSNAYK